MAKIGISEFSAKNNVCPEVTPVQPQQPGQQDVEEK